jgi:hypothetical protein
MNFVSELAELVKVIRGELEVVKMPEDIGLRGITDGEYRRGA